MALIDTHGPNICNIPYASVQEVIHDLIAADIEELDARNSYMMKVHRLQNSTNEDVIKIRDSLIDLFTEIVGDEDNHHGRLFSRRLLLDPSAIEHIKAGMAGKE